MTIILCSISLSLQTCVHMCGYCFKKVYLDGSTSCNFQFPLRGDMWDCKIEMGATYMHVHIACWHVHVMIVKLLLLTCVCRSVYHIACIAILSMMLINTLGVLCVHVCVCSKWSSLYM